ncbi:MAG TPA: sensor histidine kinase [Betaproteobacteria bacterium]|nr:sensor histidine kinase [Betaproteobacteria bacterium]
MSENEQLPDITAFLASSVHDMKNSISMMINFIEDKLEEFKVKDPQTHQQMGPMLYEVRRINNNLIQLLTIYKVGNMLYPFDLTENAINDFSDEIWHQNKPLIDTHGIQLEMEFPEGLSWYFDQLLVSGVISHALNNAVHYTQDKIKLVIREADGFLEFRVEDNGEGYPDAMLQAEEKIKHGVNFATGSTGLGLYFSTMVAKMHKNRDKTGSIILENNQNSGGCFILRLP